MEHLWSSHNSQECQRCGRSRLEVLDKDLGCSPPPIGSPAEDTALERLWEETDCPEPECYPERGACTCRQQIAASHFNDSAGDGEGDT